MLKRLIWVVVATLFFAFQLQIGSASALELDQESRTVALNESGQKTVVSLEDYTKGQRLFNSACSKCHNSGRTKTNPNVTLGVESLSGAEPPRDNLAALVDYLKYPMTYDGEEEMTLLHPNTTRSDIFPEMRNLTDDDLAAVSGYILIQPKVRGIGWGGGKVFN